MKQKFCSFVRCLLFFEKKHKKSSSCSFVRITKKEETVIQQKHTSQSFESKIGGRSSFQAKSMYLLSYFSAKKSISSALYWVNTALTDSVVTAIRPFLFQIRGYFVEVSRRPFRSGHFSTLPKPFLISRRPFSNFLTSQSFSVFVFVKASFFIFSLPFISHLCLFSNTADLPHCPNCDNQKSEVLLFAGLKTHHPIVCFPIKT